MSIYEVTFKVKKPDKLRVEYLKEWLRSEISGGEVSDKNPLYFSNLNHLFIKGSEIVIKQKRKGL